METNGNIYITEHRNHGGGIERYDFRWEGGDKIRVSKPALKLYGYIHYNSLEPGSELVVGPFRLKIIERGIFDGEILAVRHRGIITDTRYLWHRATKILDVIYRRLILTLAVWKLAYCYKETVPSWRDIRWLGKAACQLPGYRHRLKWMACNVLARLKGYRLLDPEFDSHPKLRVWLDQSSPREVSNKSTYLYAKAKQHEWAQGWVDMLVTDKNGNAIAAPDGHPAIERIHGLVMWEVTNV